MKKILYLIICLLLAFSCHAATDTFEGQTVAVGSTIEGVDTTDTVEGQTLAAALSCTLLYSSTTTVDASVACARNEETDYPGFIYKPASNQSICGVDFWVDAIVGTNALTYYVQVWTLDASTPKKLASLLGTSAGLDGATIVAAGVNKWFSESVGIATFASPVSVTAGSYYGITLSTVSSGNPTYNTVHYIEIGFDNEAGASDGVHYGKYTWQWDSSIPYEVYDSDADDGVAVKIHTMQ